MAKWACSRDGETFGTLCDTREDAIAEGSTFIGKVTEFEATDFFRIDTDAVLEHAHEHASGEVGSELVDGWPFDEVTDDMAAELEVMVNAAIAEWCNRHAETLRPRFYLVNDQERVATEEAP